ncbi:MAG TPA: putative Ig domain-containing protein [Bryobacteraceae bacterium]|nr:putative Ig domain-containing protein [Bryobacteraceae bacterium]
MTISATNGTGTGSTTLTITVKLGPPVITSATTASGTAGSAFSYQIAASNSPTSFGATGLPGGLSVNTSTGVISGTPSAAGTTPVTISATNSTGTGSTTLTVTVTSGPPVITSASTASGTVGSAFSYQITASNSPTNFGATGLPGGLSVNTSTGVISGTPSAAGTTPVTISATNSTGTGSALLTLAIAAAPVNPLPTISTLSPATATAGNPAFVLTVNGTGFLSGSVVYWNGASRQTTYWSATELTASITAADIASVGTTQVTVFNPAPGGGISAAVALPIDAPVPGSCAFTLDSTSTSLTETGTATNGVTVNGVVFNGVLPEVPLAVGISATPGTSCSSSYTATSSASWLGATAGTSGFTYTALTNPNPLARSATITVANAGGGGATFTVTEAGDPEPLLNRQVRALYQSVLGRDPDSSGFAFWTGIGSAGLGQMLDSFLTSPEAFNSDFVVMAAYQAATGAAPAFAPFTAAVAPIRAQGQTAGGLFNSLIPPGYTVQSLYQNLLNRAPTSAEIEGANAEGLAAWFQTLIAYPSNTTPVTAANDEFMSTGTYSASADHSNGLYIAMLYFVILGRDYDQSGYNFWVGVANSGGPGLLFQGPAGYPTRIQILGPGTPGQGFAGSPEFQALYQAPAPANVPVVTPEAATVRTGQAPVSPPAPGARATATTSAASPRPCVQGAPGTGCGEARPPIVTDLFCAPKLIPAGGQATCELRVLSTPAAAPVQITSSQAQVKAPATVFTRANQTHLTFQVAADPAAGKQVATIRAAAGESGAEDMIEIQPASVPVWTVPRTRAAQPGVALGFTVGAVDPAGLAVQLAASGLPAGASFDAASGRFEWIPSASQRGSYQLTFRATNTAHQSSSAEVTVTVGSPAPRLARAERLQCSPGAVATLNGSGLAEVRPSPPDPSGNRVTLGGTRVSINGQYVPVMAASDEQVRFLCPVLGPETELEATVETDAGVSEALRARMQEATPVIFSLDDAGQNQGVISVAGTADLAMPRNYRVPSHPAQPGDGILIWSTGLGSPAAVSPRAVQVEIGGAEAEVESVRAAPGHAGVYAIQARVPAAVSFGNTVPVELRVNTPAGRQFASNSVTMAVEPVR